MHFYRLILDCSVVRGLAYYTGIVFEAFDRLPVFVFLISHLHFCRAGTLRAICGGGRYDGLLGIYGGQVRL